MNIEFNLRKKGGFTLLELTIVLIIATIITSALIPQLINAYSIKAADKTALDISAIEDASRAYYIKNSVWPGVVSGNALSDLTSGNYLPASWQAVNPFGFASATPSNFSYNFSLNGPTPGSSLLISTYVPNANALTLIKNLLPVSSVDTTNNIIYASVSVPGVQPSTIPSGSILAWPGIIAPNGFLLCDGKSYASSSYPTLAPILNGGSGSSTFQVPDLRDRTIVGVDTPVGGVYSGIIPQFVTAAGDPTKAIGGTFGENAHVLQVQEIPQFTLSFPMWKGNGEGGAVRYSSSYSAGYVGTLYQSYYGNASGNANPHNVVQPSMAMGYIIKT